MVEGEPNNLAGTKNYDGCSSQFCFQHMNSPCVYGPTMSSDLGEIMIGH